MNALNFNKNKNFYLKNKKRKEETLLHCKHRNMTQYCYGSGFYVGSRNLNSGPYTCILTSAFTHWAISLAPDWISFNTNKVHKEWSFKMLFFVTTSSTNWLLVYLGTTACFHQSRQSLLHCNGTQTFMSNILVSWVCFQLLSKSWLSTYI